MVTAKHLKTDTGRDASEQFIIKNSHGVTVIGTIWDMESGVE